MNKQELDYLEKPKSQVMHVIYELIRNKAGLVSIIFLFIMIGCSILAPILSPYDPLEINAYNTLKAPDSTHYFGTDDTGRDIYDDGMETCKIIFFFKIHRFPAFLDL